MRVNKLTEKRYAELKGHNIQRNSPHRNLETDMDDETNDWIKKKAKYKSKILALEEGIKQSNNKLQQAESPHAKERTSYISQIA